MNRQTRVRIYLAALLILPLLALAIWGLRQGILLALDFRLEVQRGISLRTQETHSRRQESLFLKRATYVRVVKTWSRESQTGGTFTYQGGRVQLNELGLPGTVYILQPSDRLEFGRFTLVRVDTTPALRLYGPYVEDVP